MSRQIEQKESVTRQDIIDVDQDVVDEENIRLSEIADKARHVTKDDITDSNKLSLTEDEIVEGSILNAVPQPDPTELQPDEYELTAVKIEVEFISGVTEEFVVTRRRENDPLRPGLSGFMNTYTRNGDVTELFGTTIYLRGASDVFDEDIRLMIPKVPDTKIGQKKFNLKRSAVEKDLLEMDGRVTPTYKVTGKLSVLMTPLLLLGPTATHLFWNLGGPLFLGVAGVVLTVVITYVWMVGVWREVRAATSKFLKKTKEATIGRISKWNRNENF